MRHKGKVSLDNVTVTTLNVSILLVGTSIRLTVTNNQLHKNRVQLLILTPKIGLDRLNLARKMANYYYEND